jgi:hypothetical protein
VKESAHGSHEEEDRDAPLTTANLKHTLALGDLQKVPEMLNFLNRMPVRIVPNSSCPKHLGTTFA